jgi:hypothetical protein
MKAEILERFGCPRCRNVYTDSYNAAHCCPVEAQEVFVCAACDEKFFDKYEIKAHIEVVHEPEEEAMRERYLNAIRFSDSPPLGEWQLQIEADALIPCEEAPLYERI